MRGNVALSGAMVACACAIILREKGGEKSMPEASFTMANFNLAMEIKPADIAPAHPSPGSASEPGCRQESFRSVLARTERGSEAIRETAGRDVQSGSFQLDRSHNARGTRPDDDAVVRHATAHC